MGQVAVYSGIERRRRWEDETRLMILAEALSPGANIAQVARRHDVSTGQIYTWRRKLVEAQIEPVSAAASCDPAFAEAVMMDDGSSPQSDLARVIVVDLARERRLTIFASASSAFMEGHPDRAGEVCQSGL
ncbi:MAG TPA: transposase [Sphingobium sp.]